MWIDNFNLKSIYVAADSNYSMVSGQGSFGTPLQTVIDPRTMKVTYVQEGYSGPLSQVQQLAEKNK